ncbi:conserved hypothetical protein [Alteromonas infernus]
MVSIFKKSGLSKIAIATFLTLQRWQKLKCLLKSIKSMLLFRVKSHNKQIMALAAARWDANMCAASPFLHTCLRPLFKS